MEHEEGVGGDSTRGNNKGGREGTPREWSPPTLRRLPIAATANQGQFNEGSGKGKGSAGPSPVS